jgi:DNA polymerase-1
LARPPPPPPPLLRPQLPSRSSPCVFLIDGYALIYRAFYALIARPLTTSRGENTSAAWGVVNFLQRLRATHRPEYLGWVNDSGMSFRHVRYPAYKATRQKLTDELQADFDRGMERICAILEASHVPILTLDGFEADDVIGTLARQGTDQGTSVVIVSGDKDFHQLVRPGVWLLNPGRGGPAGVEEQWVGVENGGDRLGVPPGFVTDYLAMVGDSSDNVPGVPGIGEKTARELVESYGPLESILGHAAEVSKKRPREALQQFHDQALLSKELVTIRDDLPLTLDLEALRVREPDATRLRELYVELEFHSLARDLGQPAAPPPAQAASGQPSVMEKEQTATNYRTLSTVAEVRDLVARVRALGSFAIDTQAAIDPASPVAFDPLRSTLAGIAIAVAPGEAYYLPLRHRDPQSAAGELDLTAGGRIVEATSGLVRDEPRGERHDSGGVAPDGVAPDGVAPDGGEAAEAATLPRPAQRPVSAGSGARGTESIASRAIAAGGIPPARNLPELGSPEMAPLRELLEDPGVRKTAQNIKFDILVLRRAGIRLGGLDFDTMLASYVLDPGRRSHGLDLLAMEFLDHQMTSYEDLCGKGKAQIPYEQVPVDCARDYSCEDADMALRLRAIFEPQLSELALMPLFRDIEMPLVEALAEMEWTGIAIDIVLFRSLKARFQRERERVEQEIYAAAGEEFNINSNPKLRSILFEKLQLPVRKKTATGPSTDASVLQDLAEAGHALPELLLEYRELFKLEGTYLDALPAMLLPSDRRLHTSFSQTVASTGRLSSSDPNLQNIPVRRELGRDIRRGFIPRAGWVLLTADYSQIELRLLAHLSGDAAFVSAFQAGGDIHRQTASVIFGVPLESVTPEMRARAKTINFATIYGQGAHALSRQLKIEFAEAKLFISTYFERFQGVRAFLDAAISHARERGYVQTIFGRRRYIPELRDRNFNIRAFGERLAQNSPIQGSAADLIKIAMIRIHQRLVAGAGSARMLLQVHDELVFESPPDEAGQLRAIVVGEMEHAAQLTVPLVVGVGIGPNWVDAKTA